MSIRRSVALAAVCALLAASSGCGLFDGEEPGGKNRSPSRNTQSVEPGKLPAPVTTKVRVHGTSGYVGYEQSGATHNVLFSVYGVYRDGEYATLLMTAQLDPADPDANEDGFDLTSVLQRAHLKEKLDDDDFLVPKNADDLTLVDPNAKKAYLPAMDAEGKCLCAGGVTAIKHRQDAFTTTFAAPPSAAKTIDVSVPNVGYLIDIPVFDQQAPEVEQDTDATPGVTTAAPAASGGPVEAEVVDITGEVSNIDLTVVRSKDKVTLDANVLFEFDEATLTSKAQSRIADTAEVLKQNARGQRVQVNGYTDAKGADSYNRDLSQRRAEAVKKALEPRLTGTDITLVAKGYGEDDPVAPNVTERGRDNPKGRALNRRVEIVYRK